MSDRGSQPSSVQMGYRRSRLEPVDPATIAAPPPKTKTPSTVASAPPTAPGMDESPPRKEGICRKLLRILFLLLNIFIMIVAILLIIFGITLWIIFQQSGISIGDVAGGAALMLIINGTLLTIFAMWGCGISMAPSRTQTICYLVALTLMFVLGITSYGMSSHLGDNIYNDLNQYWGVMNEHTRSMIQSFGYCCGLNGPIDYPALPCPRDTVKGCAQAYKDMQSSVLSTSNGFLSGNIVAFVLIAATAAVLGFTGTGERKDAGEDEEADVKAHSEV